MATTETYKHRAESRSDRLNIPHFMENHPRARAAALAGSLALTLSLAAYSPNFIEKPKAEPDAPLISDDEIQNVLDTSGSFVEKAKLN